MMLDASLNNNFNRFKFHKNIYISFSGGIDSSVLLNLCVNFFCKKKYRLRVIHINHSYNKSSILWLNFCKSVCDNYRVPIYIFNSKYLLKFNLEKKFRSIRFKFFFNFIIYNSTLILAHHYNDLLETFFLRLFRGSSLKSMFGLKIKCKIGKLNIFRPFLSFKKSDIFDFSFLKKINYIIDFSNFKIEFSRNYIRIKILPLILLKYPNFYKVFFNFYKLSKDFFSSFYLRYIYFFRSKGFDLLFLNLKYLFFLPKFFFIDIINLWLSLNNYRNLSYKKLNYIYKLVCLNNDFSLFFDNFILRKKFCFLVSDFKNFLKKKKIKIVFFFTNFFYLNYNLKIYFQFINYFKKKIYYFINFLIFYNLKYNFLNLKKFNFCNFYCFFKVLF